MADVKHNLFRSFLIALKKHLLIGGQPSITVPIVTTYSMIYCPKKDSFKVFSHAKLKSSVKKSRAFRESALSYTLERLISIKIN